MGKKEIIQELERRVNRFVDGETSSIPRDKPEFYEVRCPGKVSISIVNPEHYFIDAKYILKKPQLYLECSRSHFKIQLYESKYAIDKPHFRYTILKSWNGTFRMYRGRLTYIKTNGMKLILGIGFN